MPYRPHKPGKPLRGETPTTQVSVRLTHDERAALEQHVKRRKGLTRAELIRDAMARYGLFRAPAEE